MKSTEEKKLDELPFNSGNQLPSVNRRTIPVSVTNIGKQFRLRRLTDQSGAIISLPMDHGYTLGPIPGLMRPRETVHSVLRGGASCVIVHKGLLRQLVFGFPRDKGLIVHLSGSTAFSPRPNRKILTGTVSEAVRLGADGVSCHINLGADGDFEMLSDLAQLSTDTDRLGMPLLAMMYVRDGSGNDNIEPSALAHAARVAEESGADIVKVSAPMNSKHFDEVTQGVHIPVLVAGGALKDDFDGFLETIRTCMLNGAAGVSVGRNIFQAVDPELAIKKVLETVRATIGGR